MENNRNECNLRPSFIEGRGVLVPVINKVIDLKDAYDGKGVLWSKAKGKTATRNEWYIILYWMDEINKLLEEHGGEPLRGWYWTDTEYQYNAPDAWYVNLLYGHVTSSAKTDGHQVRLVSAL